MSFMDDYWAGRTDGADIHSHIGRWFAEGAKAPQALHDYLGMTEKELMQWATSGKLPERGAP